MEEDEEAVVKKRIEKKDSDGEVAETGDNKEATGGQVWFAPFKSRSVGLMNSMLIGQFWSVSGG